MLSVLVFALEVGYVDPSEEDNAVLQVNYFEVNWTITSDTEILEIIKNWNGANYTIFNDSTLLFMNFDNRSSLGESYNNSNGTIIVDLSGKGNNGTLWVGADNSGNYTDGKYGGAYNFDGVDDYIHAGNSTMFALNESITVSAWINVKGNATHQNIVSRAFGGWGKNITFQLFANETNAIFQIGNCVVWIDLIGDIDPGWNHVTATFSNEENTTALYVNGVLNATNTSFIDNPCLEPGAKLLIGASDGLVQAGVQPSNLFNGTIDDLIIYNRTLSASEIEVMYRTSLSKFNNTQWILWENETDLAYGTYTFYACSSNSTDTNCSEERTVTIAAPSSGGGGGGGQGLIGIDWIEILTENEWEFGKEYKVVVQTWDYNKIHLVNATEIEIRLVLGNKSSIERVSINHEKTDMIQTGTGTYEISYTVPEQDIDYIKIEVDTIKNNKDAHNYFIAPIKKDVRFWLIEFFKDIFKNPTSFLIFVMFLLVLYKYYRAMRGD